MPWQIELDAEAVMARFEWARRQGRPSYHWPEVTPASWRLALREIERVTRAALAEERCPIPAGDPDGTRTLGVAAYTAGMGPLLGYWLEHDRLSADPLTRRLFELHLAHGRARADRLQVELERAAGALQAIGIEPLVVKSAHTARAYFPEPGTRPAMDVDMAVRPADFQAAEAALLGAGYTVGARERRPEKTTLLAPASSRVPRSLELLHADSQYAIDLHASLERNFFGVRTVRPTRLDESTGRPAPELGAPVRVLQQPERLLYHALHASEGLYNLTLVRIVELVLMIRRDRATGAFEWAEAEAALRDRDLDRFCYPALALAERLAPGTVDPAILRRVTDAATARMRRIVSGLAPADAQRLESVSLAESFMWCETQGDYLRRLVHMLAPAPAGRSLRRLTRQYRERFYRILRRTVSLGSRRGS